MCLLSVTAITDSSNHDYTTMVCNPNLNLGNNCNWKSTFTPYQSGTAQNQMNNVKDREIAISSVRLSFT